MKIIFSNYDSLNNPYYAGGGAVAVHEIAKLLSRNNEVIIYSGAYPGSSNYSSDGVAYRFIGLKKAGAKLGQLIYQFLLSGLVVREKFDLWIENFTPPFSAACLPLFTKKPIIGLVHMLAGPDMVRKYHLPFDRIESLLFRFYPRIIVTSEGLGDIVGKKSPKSIISVIPNGVNIPKPKSKNSSPTHLLFMGRTEVNQKGLDLLLSAFAKTKDKYPLVIAGSGTADQTALLSKHIGGLGLQNRVRLAGRVEGLVKDKLLRQAVFCIVPSRYETFSLFALESLAYGKPLLTWDISGLSWIPGSCRLMAKSFDVDDLSRKMHYLSATSAASKKLAESGYAFASGFSWDIQAEKYQTLITQICKT
jgi:glycosyltransferase involved in cell wall biosynthesis